VLANGERHCLPTRPRYGTVPAKRTPLAR
jgi:hypothetical protein